MTRLNRQCRVRLRLCVELISWVHVACFLHCVQRVLIGEDGWVLGPSSPVSGSPGGEDCDCGDHEEDEDGREYEQEEA